MLVILEFVNPTDQSVCTHLLRLHGLIDDGDPTFCNQLFAI